MTIPAPTEPPRALVRNLLRLTVLAGVTLSGACAMAKSYQPVAHMTCPHGDFVVDARPWSENEAGSSQVTLRYRYRGLELKAIHYELYYKNLDPWLRRGDPPIYNLGLNLDTSGGSRTGGYDQGDTLYLPPSNFSKQATEGLFDCLGQQADRLRRDFERAEIKSRTFFGLMATRTGVGRNGVARLVNAEAPINGIYGRGPLILIESSGRVMLQTNQTANNPAEAVAWGRLIDGSGLRQILRAERYVRSPMAGTGTLRRKWCSRGRCDQGRDSKRRRGCRNAGSTGADQGGVCRRYHCDM